jgi:hypothetical protein
MVRMKKIAEDEVRWMGHTTLKTKMRNSCIVLVTRPVGEQA